VAATSRGQGRVGVLDLTRVLLVSLIGSTIRFELCTNDLDESSSRQLTLSDGR
jgi:hypothetical protein